MFHGRNRWMWEHTSALLAAWVGKEAARINPYRRRERSYDIRLPMTALKGMFNGRRDRA